MESANQPSVFPQALAAPTGPVAAVTRVLMANAIAFSRESPRKRIIQPLHKSGADMLQRMLNVLQPGSYIQPHRHLTPPKPESFVVLAGAIGFVVFDDIGGITDRFYLSPSQDAIGIDIEPGIFHTFFAIEPDTVLFEVKLGPYIRSSDKDFASWAPFENSPASLEYLAKLQEEWLRQFPEVRIPDWD